MSEEKLCARCRERPASGVVDGLPTCDPCGELVHRKAEDTRTCPVDGTGMRKEVLHNLLIDRCPECGGIWLDQDELASLMRLAAERDEHFLNAVILGLAW